MPAAQSLCEQGFRKPSDRASGGTYEPSSDGSRLGSRAMEQAPAFWGCCAGKIAPGAIPNCWWPRHRRTRRAGVAAIWMRPRPLTAIDKFWSPVLNSAAPVSLCVAYVPVFGLNRDGSSTNPVHVEDFVSLTDEFVGGGDLIATSWLSAMLTRMERPRLWIGSDVSFHDLRTAPAILIGYSYTAGGNHRLAYFHGRVAKPGGNHRLWTSHAVHSSQPASGPPYERRLRHRLQSFSPGYARHAGGTGGHYAIWDRCRGGSCHQCRSDGRSIARRSPGLARQESATRVTRKSYFRDPQFSKIVATSLLASLRGDSRSMIVDHPGRLHGGPTNSGADKYKPRLMRSLLVTSECRCGPAYLLSASSGVLHRLSVHELPDVPASCQFLLNREEGGGIFDGRANLSGCERYPHLPARLRSSPAYRATLRGIKAVECGAVSGPLLQNGNQLSPA